MNNPIQSMYENYHVNSLDDARNAFREMSQNIVLVGLSRTNFFDKASFYGGTSLRIFRGLDRFSEDLDFTLIDDADKLNFESCISMACNELKSFGINVNYVIKEKNVNTNVITAFIKFNLNDALTLVDSNLKAAAGENISIKTELEHSWFEGGHCEFKAVVWPNFAKVRCFDMPTMFASKLLAVLQRSWKTRIKGRDYYDYMFYISQGTKVNMEFLRNGLIKGGNLSESDSFDIDYLKQMLAKRFNEIDFSLAMQDVKPFVDNTRYEDSFNKELFLLTIDNLQAE